VDEVVITYLHGTMVHAEFSQSLLFMCMASETPISAVIALASGPNLSTGRNMACRLFLTQHESPWLFMCDTDMALSLDTLDRLVGAADPVERPVLGGFCMKQNLDGSTTPTMFRFVHGPDDTIIPVAHLVWQRDIPVQVEGTGAACLLIHRSVLETVEKNTGDRAAPWFRETDSGPGQLLGEDLTFCLRCASAGIPVHVHTGIRVGHVKTQII
jgi:hypothetical protein